jgi:hypothetical protein
MSSTNITITETDLDTNNIVDNTEVLTTEEQTDTNLNLINNEEIVAVEEEDELPPIPKNNVLIDVSPNQVIDVRYNKIIVNTETNIYNSVMDILRGFEFDIKNLSIIALKTYDVVRSTKIKERTFDEKRTIIFNVCNRIIKEQLDLSENDAHFASITVGNLIDTIMSNTLKKGLKSARKHKVKHQVPPGQIIDALVNRIEGIVREKSYTPRDIIGNFSIIIGMVVSLVQQYKGITNTDKKNIVVQAIQRFLTKRLPKIVDIDADVLVLIDIAVETLPITIDALISASKGKPISETTQTCCMNLTSIILPKVINNL